MRVRGARDVTRVSPLHKVFQSARRQYEGTYGSTKVRNSTLRTVPKYLST